MNFEFSNFMAFDSKMMLIELVDNLIFSKNDQKYQHMYYQKTEEIPWTMRVKMVSFVSLYSILLFFQTRFESDRKEMAIQSND